MRPVLFEIGDFAVYSYGFMLFIAFTTSMYWALKEAPGEGLNSDYLYETFILTIALSVLGSRAAYVLINWEAFSGQPWWEIFAFRGGGLVFYGGLIAALLGGFVYSRFRGFSFWRYLDFLIPFVALGYAITRIGCFLNGCCYGHVTDLPWGMVNPVVDNLPRHPTQLYASLIVLLIFFLLRRLRHQRFFHGYVFLHFLVYYGVYRFGIEFFRVSEPVVGFLTLAQVVTLPAVLLALFLLLWGKRKWVFRGDL